MKIFSILLIVIFLVSSPVFAGSKSPKTDKIQPAETTGKNSAGNPQEASENKKAIPIFIDENGDGINDIVPNSEVQPAIKTSGRGKDRFMDKDGDGINDGRGLYRERRRKGNQWNQKGKGKGKGK